uniref:Uncharacterized protein n=1 Tax=Eucampia antarctica TaxID=49252 RepID=A0A7S2RAN5_9STRA|mmetsp:Transcript_19606/g.18815  ORF Transcript_19606/g.18815 Transcript_19606/m.18815 type:complete len:570 (+) Transcript_19606:119-1828(+)
MRTQRNHFPCLESPARCTMLCISNNRYLSSDKAKNILMAEERNDWCEWYLVPIANSCAFYIQNVRLNCFLSITKDDNRLVAIDNVGKGDTWILEKGPTSTILEGYRYLIIHEESGKYVGEGSNNDSSSEAVIVSCSQKSDRDCAWKSNKSVWALEINTGELCFISSPSLGYDVSIGCDVFGKVYTKKNMGGWELWRFVETGDDDGCIKITSWIHDGKTLCSDPTTGLVHTVDKNCTTILGRVKEKWKVKKAPNGFHGVTIQQALSTGPYLQLKEGELKTTDTFQGLSCVWHLRSANQNKYFLYSAFLNKRLATSKTDPMTSKPSSRDAPWTVKYISDDGSYEIYSEYYQRYLGSDNNGNVTVSPSSQDYEKWFVEELDDGSFNIISTKHNRFLTCDKDGKLYTVTKIADETTDKSSSCKWHLETVMPSAMTGKQILTRSLVGVAAVGMTFMAPFAVTGVIGAMGYTSGGISVGSFAAGMMSAEAIAAGGSIVAGGTVATLQSIGAVGLGVAGTSAAMGAGAAVGGSVYYGADRNLQKGKDSPGQITLDSGDIIIDKKINNRPFCAWETW